MDHNGELIGLAHGNGGRLTRELISRVFERRLGHAGLDTRADAATFSLGDGDLVMTTDSFTVQPLEFPGGDIGSLAIHGTVNDLAVAGAEPRFLSLGVIIEEGLELDTLGRIVDSMAAAAAGSAVQIVTGDTKVVRRGEGGGVYFSVAGLGVRAHPEALGVDRICDGDAVIVSGPVGDHGIAIMLAREQFGLRGDVLSDTASVVPLTRGLREIPGLRFMRDPTRGGLATVLHEIAAATNLGIRLNESAVPVRRPVRAVCEMLGYDPLYLACEGRVVAVVDPSRADTALERWRALPQGEDASIIGHVTGETRDVVLVTELGGERVLDELEDDPLPRIC